MANKILRLDITKTPDLLPIIYGRVADGLVQTVDVYVTNNGEQFDLSGWTVKFEGNTSGNSTFLADAANVKIINAVQGYFQYTFPLPAFATAGKYERAYFTFAKGDMHESTSNFNIQVFQNADITDTEAHSVITEYEKLVEKLNEIFLAAETELTQEVADYNTWLQEQITAAQNKITILNTGLDAANVKLVDLEDRMNDLIAQGLLSLADIYAFLNNEISVTIDGQEKWVRDIIPSLEYLQTNYYGKPYIDAKLYDQALTNNTFKKKVARNTITSGVTSLQQLAAYTGETFYITKMQMDTLTDRADLPAEISGAFNYILEMGSALAGGVTQQIIYTTATTDGNVYIRTISPSGGKTPFTKIITATRYGLLEFKGTVINVQDWNTLVDTGIYQVYGSSGANKPTGGTGNYGTLQIVADDITINQEYRSNTGLVYTRMRFGNPNPTWTAWTEIASAADLKATQAALNTTQNELAALKAKKVRWEGWFGNGPMVTTIRDKSRIRFGALETTKGEIEGVPMDENPFDLSNNLYIKANRDVKFYIEGSVRTQGTGGAGATKYVYWHLRVNTDLSETTGSAVHVATAAGTGGQVIQWKTFSPFSQIVSLKAGESMAFSADTDGGTAQAADIYPFHIICLN